jgi:hypothetical protein
VQNLYRKICRDTTESQLENGLVPCIAPEYTRFSAGFFESAEWGSACVLLPNQLYHTYGDRQIVQQQMETMERYVGYLAATRNEQGLAKAGLGDWYDWSPEKGHAGYSQHTPGELTATAMLYFNAKAVAEFHAIAENADKSWHYLELAEQVRQDVFNAYLKPDGTVATGSQASQAMAIAMNVPIYVTEEAGIEKQLLERMAETNNRPTVGEVVFRYLINALSDMGRDDIVWDLVTDTEKPGYGYMLKHWGMRTLSETWDGPGSSMNHCMFGHAQEWLMVTVAGIHFDKYIIEHYPTGGIARRSIALSESVMGYEGVPVPAIHDGYVIRPAVVGDLTAAEGSWLSPFGQVECSWRIENERFKCHVTIPPNLVANVHLPFVGDVDSATLDGQPLISHPDVLYGQFGTDGEIQFFIGSGTYDFETDWKPKTN